MAPPESDFGTEVFVKGFQANKYFLSKCFLGVVSPEEVCAENLPLCVVPVTLILGKGVKYSPIPSGVEMVFAFNYVYWRENVCKYVSLCSETN